MFQILVVANSKGNNNILIALTIATGTYCGCALLVGIFLREQEVVNIYLRS